MASLRAPLQFFSRLHSRGAQRLALAALLATPVLLSGQSGGYDPGPPQDQSFDQFDDTDFSDEIPANLYVVDGTVSLERDGTSQAAVENTPLLAGDRLRTGRGRVEVLFSDGSVLDVDENSTVDLQSDALMRLLAGQVRLSIARSSVPIQYRVDAITASALIRQAGDYRISLIGSRGLNTQVDLAVIRGSAELENPEGRTLVRAGTHAVAAAQLAPSLPVPYYTAATDDFDRWAEDLRDQRLGLNSNRYLPAEAQYYGGVMDRSGDWNYDTSYGGYVWYPRVSVDWRPYSVGRWSYVSVYGWTWIGADRWSWPTHHYGRWGLSGSRWFWIPDRRWGPAWVSWAIAPSYVSWCPLGLGNRPVFSLSVTYVSQPWRGWTVLSANVFSSNVLVTGRAIERNLPGSAWTSFRGSNRGPLVHDRIVSAPPLRGPGNFNRAVPRYGNAVQNGNTVGGGTRQVAPARDPAVVDRRDVRTPVNQSQYAQPNYRSAPQQPQQQPPPQQVYTPRGDIRDRNAQAPERTQVPDRAQQAQRGQTPAPGARSDDRTQTPRGDVQSQGRTRPPDAGVTPIPSQPPRSGRSGGDVQSRGDVRRYQPPSDPAPQQQRVPPSRSVSRPPDNAQPPAYSRPPANSRPPETRPSADERPKADTRSSAPSRSSGSEGRVNQPSNQPSGPPPQARSQQPSGSRTPPSTSNNSNSSNGTAKRRGGG